MSDMPTTQEHIFDKDTTSTEKDTSLLRSWMSHPYCLESLRSEIARIFEQSKRSLKKALESDSILYSEVFIIFEATLGYVIETVDETVKNCPAGWQQSVCTP